MRKAWAAVAAALALLLSAACFAEVENIADQCKFWVSQGSASAISDSSLGSAWKPQGEGEARVMLPDSGAAWIQVNWSIPPTSYTLTEYDASQTAISTRETTEEENFGCLSQLIPVTGGAKYISIKFNQSGQGINKIRVYPEGELPKTAVQWEKPLDKCDLLVVSTHQDDEWLWFGAIIPYYDLVQDKDVQVVYMANCGRYRYQEALNSIAVSGVKTYPHFVGLKDKRDKNLTAAINTWTSREYIIGVMAEVIRRYKPEVILTHDWDGEYGHPQHILTSRCMEYAIEAAADASQYPESAQKYGAWQVKKLYRHLEEKGRIEFDWHVPYEEFGGRTGIQVATDSMAEHASQLKYYQVEDHGKYDNSLFGLSWSAVGDDVEHKDLFENIDASPAAVASAGSDAAPEPAEEAAESNYAPAEELESELEIAPTQEPSLQGDAMLATESTPGPEDMPPADPGLQGDAGPAPELTPEPAPERESGGSAAPFLIAGAAAVACAGIGYLIYTSRPTRKRRRKRRRQQGRQGHQPQRQRQGHQPQRQGQQGRRSQAAATKRHTSGP